MYVMSTSGVTNQFGENDQKNQCQYCNKIFKYPRLLDRHLLIHSGDKPFACNHCQFSTNRNDSLIRHVKTCHPEFLNLHLETWKCLLLSRLIKQNFSTSNIFLLKCTTLFFPFLKHLCYSCVYFFKNWLYNFGEKCTTEKINYTNKFVL